MTKELKQALRTIAEYDGLTLRDDTFWMDPDEERSGYWENIIHTRYHTSADALLPVWRKVSTQINSSLKTDYSNVLWWKNMSDTLDAMLKMIGAGSYEWVCIALAILITKLKERA